MQSDKQDLIEENNRLSNQLKLKEVQVVFSDELKRLNENEGNSMDINIEPSLSENEISMVFI